MENFLQEVWKLKKRKKEISPKVVVILYSCLKIGGRKFVPQKEERGA
jgi:hypothetical protein